jgi:hypothetical protein
MANTAITIRVSEQATAELEVEFDIRPGMRPSWDDDGWPAEIDGYSFEIDRIEFESGTVIRYDWLKTRGLYDYAVAVLNRRLDPADVEDALGNLEDYLYDE